MARSTLINPENDLISDSGSVLWSFIKGEQLEFPITLKFIPDATAPGYIYEAVVVEGANIANDITPPIGVEPGGVSTVLTVRVPVNRGNWDAPQAYNKDEIVKHGGLAYKLLQGVAYTSAITPDLDPNWAETTTSTIYVQFPKTLSGDWKINPVVGFPVYGFFELRVTEPASGSFIRTWKPVRGMTQILFSPTFSPDD